MAAICFRDGSLCHPPSSIMRPKTHPPVMHQALLIQSPLTKPHCRILSKHFSHCFMYREEIFMCNQPRKRVDQKIKIHTVMVAGMHNTSS